MRFFFPLLSVLLFSYSYVGAADHAVVLLYHHVSEDTPPSTSVSPEIFRKHLDYLAQNGFSVLPLSRILYLLEQKQEIPDNTVAITFDDAYVSVLDNAFPLLQKRNWPFTVFVNTRAIDQGYSSYLRWNDLEKLLAGGGEIGNHSHDHAHLVRLKPGETPEQWTERVSEDISTAGTRLEEELGVKATMFAYPYGEYNNGLQEIVARLGMQGIAQQSGAVGFGYDRLAVPRYPMATNYADMNRFITSVNSRPLPVRDEVTGQMVLEAGKTSGKELEFTLLPGDYREEELACYSSSGTKLTIRRSTSQGISRCFVELPEWQPGRRKVNCTAPARQGGREYYWRSWQWLVKLADGGWYSE